MECNDKNSKPGLNQKKNLINQLTNITDYKDDILKEKFQDFFSDTQKEDILITGIKF